MRRTGKGPSRKFSADSQKLATLAQSLVLSASRIEQRRWEDVLDAQLQKLLGSNQQNAIDSALDHLFHTDLTAYDALLECVEAVSSSATLTHDGRRFDALLLAIPMLAWTRFTLPSGTIAGELLQALSAHLHEHVLAKEAKAIIAPALFSIDHLPRSYCDTFALTRKMAEAARAGTALHLPAVSGESAPFLADTRFLLAVVTADAGAPLMRWQEAAVGLNLQASSQAVFTHWQTKASPDVQRLFPGCGVELLLPEAYYIGCREADKKIRPVSIRAAVHYLIHALPVDAGQLSAVIGGFGDETNGMRVDEYRISFTVADNPDVVYGVTWPLYEEEGDEDELQVTTLRRPLAPAQTTPLQQIVSLLREAGVTRITHLDALFPPEFCEDCGSPLFCDHVEDLVHAEMPEDTAQPSGHLH